MEQSEQCGMEMNECDKTLYTYLLTVSRFGHIVIEVLEGPLFPNGQVKPFSDQALLEAQDGRPADHGGIVWRQRDPTRWC